MTAVTREMRDAAPEPLYPCAIESCRDEHTWPASDLWWLDAGVTPYGETVDAGFYCDECLNELGVEGTFEVSLADVVGKVREAAPMMLEALENLENDSGDTMPASAWKLVQDAIAKAGGRTHD